MWKIEKVWKYVKTIVESVDMGMIGPDPAENGAGGAAL